VQIENGHRSPKAQRPGAIRQGQFREIETVIENPDAEPALPCPHTKSAIIVFGKHVGKTLTVCTDPDCPVHDPRAAARQAASPAPVISPVTESETEAEAEAPEAEHEQHGTEHEEEQQRRSVECKQQFERQQQE
jgi:ParB family chromosome partitioning protein